MIDTANDKPKERLSFETDEMNTVIILTAPTKTQLNES